MTKDDLDPKGLILEAYRMDGISPGECRSIFLDWALGVPLGIDPKTRVKALLDRHMDHPADHPMTVTLKAAMVDQGPAKRRGGRAGRMQ